MKHLTLLLPALLLAACAPTTHEPANLSVLKKEVKAYSESPLYEQDIATAVRDAKSFLRKRHALGGQNLTVVFDIDETALSNLPHMKAMDWGYNPDRWDAWVDTAKGKAIKPVKEIYDVATELGMKVIFMTGRKEPRRAATARNLRLAGMGKYEKLIMRPAKGSSSSEDAINYKTRARMQLTKQGYTIVANFGDQLSDLEGGYAERTYKIPNPFYKID